MTAPGVVDAFAEVRPTFMVVVPQLLSRIRQAARDRAGRLIVVEPRQER